MIDHNFVDPEIIHYWKTSCVTDPKSAGCRFFHTRLAENVEEINPYSKLYIDSDVYSYCYYNDSFVANQGEKPKTHQSQQSMLFKLLAKARNEEKSRFNGAPCSYFDGVFNYFNLNVDAFHPKDTGMKWNGPCLEDIHYDIDLRGSIPEYRYLLSRLS